MPTRKTGQNTFDAALERFIEIYKDKSLYPMVSFSGGKDSGVCVELAVMAAKITGNLPVRVVMRDEEVMFPGTFEYAERMASRPEIDFHWLYACQPVLNVFNRDVPYWWVFDPRLSPDDWVRTPPPMAKKIDYQNIEAITSRHTFPIPEGVKPVTIIGLRVSESVNRKLGLLSSGGYMSKHPNSHGTWKARPIYDWSDGDVWLAHKIYQWDYNSAYDVMHRMGVPRNQLRIAPPTMNAAGAGHLRIASQAWPKWFDQVSIRLPGTRAVAHFGKRVLQPTRKLGETWEECYQRSCIDDAPAWIAERAILLRKKIQGEHSNHSTDPIPEIKNCPRCRMQGSWRALTKTIYLGDPIQTKTDRLPLIQPEFFREGAGTWGGTPSF